eukprot:gene8017-16429_t
MRSRQGSPMRSFSPSRSLSPSRAMSPARGVSPLRPISPGRGGSPARSRSPVRFSPSRGGRSYVQAPTGQMFSGNYSEGDLIEVINGSGNWVTARVSLANGDGTYDVRYEDGFEDRRIEMSRMRRIGGGGSGSDYNRNFTEGSRVEARYRGKGKYYPGRISRMNNDDTYEITFDYGETVNVHRDSIRPYGNGGFDGNGSNSYGGYANNSSKYGGGYGNNSYGGNDNYGGYGNNNYGGYGNNNSSYGGYGNNNSSYGGYGGYGNNSYGNSSYGGYGNNSYGNSSYGNSNSYGGYGNNSNGGYSNSYGGYGNNSYGNNSYGGYGNNNSYGGYGNNNNYGGYGNNNSYGGYGNNNSYGGYGNNNSYGGYGNNSYGGYGNNSYGGYGNNSYGGYGNNSYGGYRNNSYDNNNYGGYGNKSFGGGNGFDNFGQGYRGYRPGSLLEYGGYGNNGSMGYYPDHQNGAYNGGSNFKPFSVGSLIEVQSTRNAGQWMQGRITICNANDMTYDIELDDGTMENNVTERSIRWRDGFHMNHSGSSHYRPGMPIEARYRGSTKYSMGVIESCRPDDTYDIRFNDGTVERGVQQDMMRPSWNNMMGGNNMMMGGGMMGGNNMMMGGMMGGNNMMMGGMMGGNNMMMSRMRNQMMGGDMMGMGGMFDGPGMYGPRNFPSMVSGSPTETGFGVFYAREVYPDQWSPMVPYVYDVFQEYFYRYQSQRRHAGFEKMYGLGGNGHHFCSPGFLPPGCELTIVPCSEWCDFSGGEPSFGRVVWNGWRVSCPFFFRPRQGAPRNFTMKVIFFARSVMVAEVTFEITMNNGPRVEMMGATMIGGGNMNGTMGMNDPNYRSISPSRRGQMGLDGRSQGNYGRQGDGTYQDMPGADRRVPMFRSIYMVHPENDDALDMLMMETLMTVPGMTIRRRDPNQRISDMYIRTCDRVQLVCSREGNRGFSSDSFSDLRSVQGTLVTPEERVRKLLLTFADLPLLPPQEIERLPGCNFSFCPELSIYRWLQMAQGQQFDLRQRLYEGARAITKAYLEVCDRPVPMGMLMMSGGNDYYQNGFGGDSRQSGLGSAPWNLFFMCEDHASQTMRDEFAHRPVEMRFDPQFMVDAYPLMKATVAVMMYCRLTSNDMIPYFPTPFNAYGLSKRFDENMLVDMANFYDEQARECRSTYFKAGGAYGNEAWGDNGESSSYPSMNRSPSRRQMYNDRDNYDSGSFQMMRSSNDFLFNAVQYVESALSCLHQWGLGRSARKVRARLDEIAPTWLQQCDMRPLELDLKVWWVSPMAYEERWRHLHMMVCPPGTPGYQQYLQLSGMGGNYNGRSAEPFELDYHNAFFHQQQGRNANDAYRGPMTEISSRLMGEMGIKDFSVANEVAMRLSQEGCETWDDVLRLDEFVGSKNNFDDVKWFLRDIGVPMVVASKLMSMMRNYRGSF